MSAAVRKHPFLVTPALLAFAIFLVYTVASQSEPTSVINYIVYGILGLIILIIIFYNAFKGHAKEKINGIEDELNAGEGEE